MCSANQGKPKRGVVHGRVHPQAPPALHAEIRLLNPCATPLNQNDQHDDKEHAGNNPDNRGTVHVDSPFI